MTTNLRYPERMRRGAQQNLDLATAYNAVFTLKKPTSESLQMVMDDLAEFTGYFSVPPAGTSAEEANYYNGQRSVFARILSLIELSDYELNRLRADALVEMQISAQEGER